MLTSLPFVPVLCVQDSVKSADDYKTLKTKVGTI